MGILKSIGDFLFGKDPQIFDNNGNIIHKHPKKLWESWSNRIKNDAEYNWRNHTGNRAGHETNPIKSPDKK